MISGPHDSPRLIAALLPPAGCARSLEKACVSRTMSGSFLAAAGVRMQDALPCSSMLWEETGFSSERSSKRQRLTHADSMSTSRVGGGVGEMCSRAAVEVPPFALPDNAMDIEVS
jgi:hypothetical protein